MSGLQKFALIVAVITFSRSHAYKRLEFDWLAIAKIGQILVWKGHY